MKTLYSILLAAHIICGALALASGLSALLSKKGRKAHRLSGKIFFFSMLVSAVVALIICALPNHHNIFLFLIGLFSIYFLVGGSRSIGFKHLNHNFTLDKVVAWFMLIAGMVMLGLGVKNYPTGSGYVLMLFGLIGGLFAVRDLRNFNHLALARKNRLKHHIGKMVGGYISSVTAFMVVNQFLPGMWNWFVPSVLGSIYIAFWTKKLDVGALPKRFIIAAVCLASYTSSFSQVYIEKQSRHRFAQLNVGLDVQRSIGGNSTYFDVNTNQLAEMNLNPISTTRILIGGTHFWGHADFLLKIPLHYPSYTTQNQDISHSSGVETVFKYYPFRIKNKQLRPYIGLALATNNFRQDNNLFPYPNGPLLFKTNLPLQLGGTYNRGNHLVELSYAWHHQNTYNYFIGPLLQAEINTPPHYISLSYRYMLETTLGAEKQWESGRTARVTKKLAEAHKLSNFFVAVGMSSASWLGTSTHNATDRPYMPNFDLSVMPEFAVGYYIHQPDLNLVLNYRSYSRTAEVYSTVQEQTRRSIAFEVTKHLFDYHGFTPFIGPVLGYERLSFNETENKMASQPINAEQLAFGINVGWDIRPNRLQAFILRTNLRYFPKLRTPTTPSGYMSFDAFEFNFIQLVLFPGRMF